METLEKLMVVSESDINKPHSPLVSVHVGSNSEIKEVGNNKLEITDKTASDLLKALAAVKKQAQDD
jgi:hypothetical protein